MGEEMAFDFLAHVTVTRDGTQTIRPAQEANIRPANVDATAEAESTQLVLVAASDDTLPVPTGTDLKAKLDNNTLTRHESRNNITARELDTRIHTIQRNLHLETRNIHQGRDGDWNSTAE